MSRKNLSVVRRSHPLEFLPRHYPMSGGAIRWNFFPGTIRCPAEPSVGISSPALSDVRRSHPLEFLPRHYPMSGGAIRWNFLSPVC